MRRWLISGGLAALLLLTVAWPAMAETQFTQVAGLSRIKAVAAAGDTFVALRADGTVWTWHADADGDGLGDAVAPHQVAVGCPVREVSAGAEHLALLCADGTVWVAGIAIDETGVHRAVQIQGLDQVKAVSLSRPSLVALKTDGTVWVGELAQNGPPVRRMERVPDLSDVISVAAGVNDFAAVLTNGQVAVMAIKSKGTGAQRLANVPPVRSAAVCGPDDDCDGAVCGPDNDCDDADPYLFTTVDGQVLAWSVGADGVERTFVVGQSVCNPCVAAGHRRALFVTAGGTAQTALLSADGTVTVADTGRPGPAVKQVAAGRRYEVGLAANGTVWMWAAPNRPTQVAGLEEITAVASGGDWHLALAADGRLVCWGSNSSDTRRTHVIPHVFDVRGIAAADDYFVTLNADGSVAVGQCPAPGAAPKEPIVHRDIAARWVRAGIGHVLVVKADGGAAVAEIAIDEDGVHFSGGFHAVDGLESIVQAEAGANGYIALRADGTVWGARWGSPPAQVQGLGGARAVAAGGTSFAVLLGDGSVRGVAIDDEGVHVWGDPHVDESDGIAAGGGAGGAVVVRADGAVFTFSRTVGAGQVTEILDIVAVSSGGTENLALRADGTVWSWRR
ncbi:MAG: repeat domain protein [Symbiobacteriaceae bacterium]|jgi:alpha-tubulin suppressor-like RCC1 family protein|nr:repeat domain protein [Symbiobacteriaceae bacterium]